MPNGETDPDQARRNIKADAYYVQLGEGGVASPDTTDIKFAEGVRDMEIVIDPDTKEVVSRRIVGDKEKDA